MREQGEQSALLRKLQGLARIIHETPQESRETRYGLLQKGFLVAWQLLGHNRVEKRAGNGRFF
jgi:hypothetical protein